MSLDGKTNWRFKGMTDVASGRMTLKQVNQEIRRYMLIYGPLERMIVDIQRKENGYHGTIWVPNKTLNRKCVGCKKISGSKICPKCMELLTEISMV